jgi:hypothetical protein
MPSLIPNLKARQVNPSDLLLDPNNPRYFSSADDLVPSGEIANEQTQRVAEKNMEKYKIDELKKSITRNGYVPTDSIFVTEHASSGKYLVREGNRRVTAIKQLLTDPKDLDKETEEALKYLTVLEVQTDGDADLANRQISYLLGVRHHGSLRKWSPFARAANAFKSYLAVSGQDKENFRWDDDVAKEVAHSLSVEKSEIEKGFKVYRAMEQLDEITEIRQAGGMKGKYYSLMEEALTIPRRKGVIDHIKQDPVSFLLEPEAVERMDKLCRFSTPNRQDAPVSAPAEWRSLNNILLDEDESKKEEMLNRIQEDGVKPSDVYAARSAEKKKINWAKWLKEIDATLEDVNAKKMKNKKGTPEWDRAVSVLTQLNELIKNLGTSKNE